MPNKTVKVNAANSRLLPKNANSRDHGPSSLVVGAVNVSTRAANNMTLTSKAKPKKPRKTGPIGDWVKLCTELNTPERVMNVPSRVSRNEAITSAKVKHLQPFKTSK